MIKSHQVCVKCLFFFAAIHIKLSPMPWIKNQKIYHVIPNVCDGESIQQTIHASLPWMNTLVNVGTYVHVHHIQGVWSSLYRTFPIDESVPSSGSRGPTANGLFYIIKLAKCDRNMIKHHIFRCCPFDSYARTHRQRKEYAAFEEAKVRLMNKWKMIPGEISCHKLLQHMIKVFPFQFI